MKNIDKIESFIKEYSSEIAVYSNSVTYESKLNFVKEQISFYKENWKAWGIEVKCNLDNILLNIQMDIGA